MDTPILFRILTIFIVSILRIGIKEKKKKGECNFFNQGYVIFCF